MYYFVKRKCAHVTQTNEKKMQRTELWCLVNLLLRHSVWSVDRDSNCGANADHREKKWDPDTILVETNGKETSLFLCVKRLTCGSPSGIPIKTTLDNPSTVQYAGLIHQLVMKARSTVRDIDPQNDLTFLRVRSKKNEVMIAPGRSSQEGGVSWCRGDDLRSSEFSEARQQRLELLQ